MSATRQRGVRASRAKLDKRMAALGVKTQAQLARRIADIEGLDAPPKDLVSRVFRQQRVDHNTLDRVAAALDVESYQLYLTLEDASTGERAGETSVSAQDVTAPTCDAPTGTLPGTEAVTQPRGRRFWWSRRIGGISLQLVLLTALLLVGWQASRQYAGSDHSEPMARLVTLNTLLVPQQRSLYPLLQRLLHENSHWRVALLPEAFFGMTDLSQARRDFEVDQVLFAQLVTLDGAQVLVIKRGSTVQDPVLMRSVLTHNETQVALGYLAKKFEERLASDAVDVDGKVLERSVNDALLEARARMLAERHFDAESLNEADYLLTQVHQPSAMSWAVRCQMLVNAAWQRDEKAGFDAAKQACEQALARDPAHPFVLATNAYRLMRNGHYEQAATEYGELRARYPDHLETLLGAAELSAQRYLQSPTSAAHGLTAAISLAERARDLARDDWRPYQQLTTYHFLAGDTKAALAATDRVNRLNPHQLSLANGALLNLCFSRMAQAERYARQLLESAPDYYLAHETLFYIAAYQRRPEAALAFMERAMSVFEGDGGGLHLQWGQLADAYRWSGQTDKATEAYRRALKEFAQDRAKRQLAAADEIFGLYYQQALYRLAGNGESVNRESMLQDIALERLSSAQQYKAAVLLAWLDQPELARQALAQAQTACAVYGNGVDVAQWASRRSDDVEL